MNIKIRNFRGASVADIEHEKISLIGGNNGNGKTSLAQAIASALVGSCIVGGLTKSDQKGLIRDGAKEAIITISDSDKFTASISFPSGAATAKGTVPKLSSFAAGVDRLDYYRKKNERAELISKIISLEPTIEDLEKELKSLDFSAEMIEATKKRVKESGWLNVLAACNEKMTKNKGAWEYVTGERYGSRKAEEWIPAEYYPALDELDIELAKTKVAELQKEYETAITCDAVSAIEIEGLKQLSAKVKEYVEDEKQKLLILDSERAVIANLKKAKLDIEKKYNGLVEEQHCPECGVLLIVNPVTGKIEHSKAPLAEEKEADTKKIADLGNEITEKETKLNKETAPQYNAAYKLKVEATSATERLSQIKEVDSDKYKQLAEELKKQIDTLTIQVSAIEKKKKAKELSDGIANGKKLSDIMGPDGLRKIKTNEALREMNVRMEILSTSAGFGETRINEDFELTYNNRILPLCSQSECFKANLIFQSMIAERDGSEVIIVDGADIIIDRPGRNGLLKMLNSLAINVFIFMSFSEPKFLPPMERLPGGKAFWINQGVLSEQKSAAE